MLDDGGKKICEKNSPYDLASLFSQKGSWFNEWVSMEGKQKVYLQT